MEHCLQLHELVRRSKPPGMANKKLPICRKLYKQRGYRILEDSGEDAEHVPSGAHVRPPDRAARRPWTTILGPPLTPVPPPRLILTPTRGTTSQSSLQPVPIPREVPDGRGPAGAPGPVGP